MTDNVHTLEPDDGTPEPTRESLLKEPSQELLSKIIDIHEKVRSQKEERQAINKSISAAYSELESEGLDKKAVKDVIKIYEMDEDQRWIYDMSASVVRKALRIPLQGDLFVEKQLEQSAADHQEHQQATG
ncbi:MAG: GapR family DNA-binding domain-containing protein [Candidatus Thiodiazotropha endolucinida]